MEAQANLSKLRVSVELYSTILLFGFSSISANYINELKPSRSNLNNFFLIYSIFLFLLYPFLWKLSEIIGIDDHKNSFLFLFTLTLGNALYVLIRNISLTTSGLKSYLIINFLPPLTLFALFLFSYMANFKNFNISYGVGILVSLITSYAIYLVNYDQKNYNRKYKIRVIPGLFKSSLWLYGYNIVSLIFTYIAITKLTDNNLTDSATILSYIFLVVNGFSFPFTSSNYFFLDLWHKIKIKEVNALIYKYLLLFALYLFFIILFVKLILPTLLVYLLNPKFYILSEHTELIIFLAATSILTKLISNYFIFKKFFKIVFLTVFLKVTIFMALIYNNFINLNNIINALFISDLFYLLAILLVLLFFHRFSEETIN